MFQSLIKDVTNAIIAELVVEPAHAVRRPFLGPIAPRTIPFLLAPRIPKLTISDQPHLIASLALSRVEYLRLKLNFLFDFRGGTKVYLIFNKRKLSSSFASIIE